MTIQFSPDDTARIVFDCIEHFRIEFGPDMPIQRLSVLLAVALNPRVQQLDISRLVPTSDSSISRNVMDLTYMTRSKEPGPELLVQIPDPAYRRRNLVEVSTKGQRVLVHLAALATKAYNKGEI